MLRRAIARGWVMLTVMLLPAALYSAYAASPVNKAGSSPIYVQIKPEKEIYEAGEVLEGNVIIINTSQSKLSGVFDIRILHDEKEVFFLSKVMKVIYPGRIRHSFKTFGIPSFTKWADSNGTWIIKIIQKDQPYSQGALVVVKVVPRQPGVNKQE